MALKLLHHSLFPATSMCENYGSFANVYPMDLLLRALAIRIETLYYTFIKYQVSNQSTTRPAQNNNNALPANQKKSDEIHRRNGRDISPPAFGT